MVEIDEYGRRRNRHYTGPPGQGNGGHLEPLTGERAEEEEDFIAGIGRWFDDNGQTMPAFLSLGVLAIIASIIVFSVVQTWRSGDSVSAIIVAIIFGFWLCADI